MTVREFARLAGMSVETLAMEVVGASNVVGGSSEARRVADASDRELEPTIESALADLVGRATLGEVKGVLDRWLLGMVLGQHHGNMTHTAARLGISRRRLRERWAAVRGVRGRPTIPRRTATPAAVALPLPSLTALVMRGDTYSDVHEVVERWLAACVLEREGGNVSSAARILGISRRIVRELRDDSR